MHSYRIEVFGQTITRKSETAYTFVVAFKVEGSDEVHATFHTSELLAQKRLKVVRKPWRKVVASGVFTIFASNTDNPTAWTEAVRVVA